MIFAILVKIKELNMTITQTVEICNECGISVKFQSGNFVNRVPDCNSKEHRKIMGKPFPEGDFICPKCINNIYDNWETNND